MNFLVNWSSESLHHNGVLVLESDIAAADTPGYHPFGLYRLH
jgi:hypothetical protein